MDFLAVWHHLSGSRSKISLFQPKNGLHDGRTVLIYLQIAGTNGPVVGPIGGSVNGSIGGPVNSSVNGPEHGCCLNQRQISVFGA